MSKWKTTQRRNKKLDNSEFGGNLSRHSYTEPLSDGSSLSFLDDMLTPGAPRETGRGTQNTPSQQIQTGDIDDILDLLSAPESESRRGSNSSVMSGHSSRGKKRREPEPTSPYAPMPVRSSMRALSRYGSGGGQGHQSREHSRDPPSRPSGSEPTNYRSGGGAPRSGDNVHRGSRSREHSREPSHRPTSGNTNFRSEERVMSTFDADDYVDDDNVMPIPLFQVQTDDDDTISCITTSVTSHYEVESRSGSFPWSRRSQRSTSHGENSYADTLDEIADMLHPNQEGRSSGLGPTRAGVSKSPVAADDFFRPPAAKTMPSAAKPLYTPSDAPSLNADEIYRGTKGPNRLSPHYSWMAYGEPFLSQTRLLIRYWISLVWPRHWRKKGGKGDNGQGYLGMWNGSSDPKLVPRSKLRQTLWKSLLCSVSGFFFVMTLTILLIRLTFLHGPKLQHRAMGQIRAITKKKGQKQLSGNDVHGSMAKRSDGSTIVDSGGDIIVGGMAHHSVEEVNSLPKKNDYIHQDHLGIELPAPFNTLADVTDLPVLKGVDAPFYWHIPRSGGGTVNDVFGGCLSLTLASDAGGIGPAAKENKLEVIKVAKHFSYVNVDTATQAGIERAKRLDAIGSGMVDITVSSLLYQALSLFSERHKGRLFTIIRHPVERAVSLFHYVQDTQWRRRQTFQKELSDLTIEEYFESGLSENNWMTRFLVNEPTKGELSNDDLQLAKEILRRKCLIGLLKEKGESFARFERYFGFPLKNDDQKDCHEKKLQWAWPQKHRHDEVEENTPLWDLILSHNVYDMELYHYASEVLFVEQAEMFK